MQKNQIFVKKKLPQATASKRIFARFFDYLLNLTFWFLFIYLFQINGFSVYKIFGSILTSIIFSNLYFIFFLYKFKQTLFMFFFKIKIFNDEKNKTAFFIKILRHEFFLISLYHIAFLILAIIFLIIGDDLTIKFFQFLFNYNFDSSTSKPDTESIPIAIKIFAYFYSGFSFFLFLIIFIVAIATIVRSKKRTYIDAISWTYTLSLKPEVEKVKKHFKRIDVDMPGVFNEEDILKEKEK